MLVHSWMTREPATLAPDNSLLLARSLMRRVGIHHIPVVQEDGTLIGIVSDRGVRDYSPSVCHEAQAMEIERRIAHLTVERVMSLRPVTVTADASIGEAARLMLEHRIGCLPVVRGRRLVGMLTMSDVLRSVAGLEGSLRQEATAEEVTALGGEVER